MKRSLAIAATFTALLGTAHADQFTDTIVANLRDLGYDFIEVQNGISQTKVEAIRGSDKLEVIYDRTTGSILKQERERADAGEIGRTGLQVRYRDRNFVDQISAPAASSASANSAFNDRVVERLTAEGYNFIEIEHGLTQIKVEAIRGTEKLEVIYDRETGEIIKQEVQSASARETGRSGLEIKSRSRDFVGDGGSGRRSGRDDDEDDEFDDDENDESDESDERDESDDDENDDDDESDDENDDESDESDDDESDESDDD